MSVHVTICIIQECNKPQDAFGFEQAEKQYTLRTFGEMANSFKRDYFGRQPHVSDCLYMYSNMVEFVW